MPHEGVRVSMTTRECPACGKAVRLENMRKHFANVHPGKDPTLAISDEEHRKIRKANRGSVPPFYTRKPFFVVVAVVVILIGGFVGVPYLLHAGSPGSSNIVTFCGLEGTVEHYHPLLVIYDNGLKEHLPYDPSQSADIGYINQPGFTNSAYYCPNGETHVLHTHDGSGIIHVELPFVPSSPPTLDQFFTIWSEPLGQTQVWTYNGHVTATMFDSDTGATTDYSSNPASIPLYESVAGPSGNAYPIPQYLISNGAYGTGQSGGTFSGEIIWLNVTS